MVGDVLMAGAQEARPDAIERWKVGTVQSKWQHPLYSCTTYGVNADARGDGTMLQVGGTH